MKFTLHFCWNVFGVNTFIWGHINVFLKRRAPFTESTFNTKAVYLCKAVLLQSNDLFQYDTGKYSTIKHSILSNSRLDSLKWYINWIVYNSMNYLLNIIECNHHSMVKWKWIFCGKIFQISRIKSRREKNNWCTDSAFQFFNTNISQYI